MILRRSLLGALAMPAIIGRAALAAPCLEEERRKLLKFGDLLVPPANACGSGGGSGTAFSDNFASFNSNLWFRNSFYEGGDALWVNNPTLTPSVYTFTGGHMNLNVLVTPGGATQGGVAITQPYISGIIDTFNAPNNFSQQYGYFEVTIACDRFPGLEYECTALSAFNFPPAFAVVRIYTDGSNVQHVQQFYYGGTDVWEITSSQGWDASVTHSYGVNWTPSVIEFYRDRQLVNSSPNPGGAYTNGDAIYVKMYSQANFQGSGPILTPASLPKANHPSGFNVWSVKPF